MEKYPKTLSVLLLSIEYNHNIVPITDIINPIESGKAIGSASLYKGR
jgi:hypothetical protein